MPRLQAQETVATAAKSGAVCARHLAVVRALLCVGLSSVAASAPAQDIELDTMVITATPPSSVYSDTYIFDEAEVYRFSVPGVDELEGLRRYETETLFYSSRDSIYGDDTEYGTRFRLERETRAFGTFDVEGHISRVDSNFLNRAGSGTDSLITVRQSSMALSATSLMDATLGHQRTSVGSILAGGYRFRLPTSIMLGASTVVRDSRQTMRFVAGNTGRYRGVRLRRFEETGGRMTSVAYESEVNQRIAVGAQLVDISGDDDIRDHTSMLLAMMLAPPDETRENAVRLMSDGDGHLAIWTDNRQKVGRRPIIHYGAYRFDEGIVWADRPITSGQQGMYLRVDRSNSRVSLSGGYDMVEAGLDASSSNSVLAQTIFANSSLRLRRDLNVGFSASFGTRDYSGPTADERLLRIRGYSNLNADIGGFRFEVFHDEIGSPDPRRERTRDGLGVTLDWDMPEQIRLSTELRFEDEGRWQGSERYAELSTLFRYALLDNVSVSTSASLYQSTARISDDDGMSLNADIEWSFLPHWDASFAISRNRAKFDWDRVPALTYDDDVSRTSLFISVRYSRDSGRAFPRYGAGVSGVVGSGQISGVVYFDENGDSVRQPSEEVAAGAVVVLDGGYETRTNEQGIYTFSPVAASEHSIALIVDDLPLPWSLDDERPRRVSVRFRETTTLDFPLVVVR